MDERQDRLARELRPERGTPAFVEQVDVRDRDRVTEVAEPEFSRVRFHGDEERAEEVYEGFTPLAAGDVAEAILLMATRPPHVNQLDAVLLPTDQRNVYVADRDESGASE